MSEEKLLTTKELAEVLNVHPITVTRMVRNKRIPYIKIGGTEFRYKLNEVLKALEVDE